MLRSPALSRLLLAGLAAVTLWLAWEASRLEIESDNRSLVVRRAEDAAREAHFAATFGRDDDLLMAVVHPRLLAPDGLRFVDALAGDIRRIPGVGGVHALTGMQTVAPGPTGAVIVPLLPRPWDAPDAERRKAGREAGPEESDRRRQRAEDDQRRDQQLARPARRDQRRIGARCYEPDDCQLFGGEPHSSGRPRQPVGSITGLRPQPDQSTALEVSILSAP